MTGESDRHLKNGSVNMQICKYEIYKYDRMKDEKMKIRK
jgi:hypothetical protein